MQIRDIPEWIGSIEINLETVVIGIVIAMVVVSVLKSLFFSS